VVALFDGNDFVVLYARVGVVHEQGLGNGAGDLGPFKNDVFLYNSGDL